MSLLRPSDPIPPQDTTSGADIRTASLTGSLSAGILWALQTYVWHDQVPEQVALFVWTIVPYVLAYISGHAVRRRRHCAAGQIPPAPPQPPAAG